MSKKFKILNYEIKIIYKSYKKTFVCIYSNLHIKTICRIVKNCHIN